MSEKTLLVDNSLFKTKEDDAQQVQVLKEPNEDDSHDLVIEYNEGVILQSREAKGAFLEVMQMIVPKIVEMYNDGCWNLSRDVVPKITKVVAFQSLARSLAHRKNIFSVIIYRENDQLQLNKPLELDVVVGPLQKRAIIDHEDVGEIDLLKDLDSDILSWVEPYIIIHPKTGYLLARMDHTGPESVQKIRKFSDVYESAEVIGVSPITDLRETIADIDKFDQFIVVFRST